MGGRSLKVDCAACHHVALLTPEALLRAGLSPAAKVLDLKGRLRCRGCCTKGRADGDPRFGGKERRLRGDNSTPLPLGFPGRVIVAKPVDPTGRRSTKCQPLDVSGELVLSRALLTRAPYSLDRRALAAPSPWGRLGRAVANSQYRPPLGPGSQGPAARDRRRVLLPAAQERGGKAIQRLLVKCRRGLRNTAIERAIR